MRACAIAARPDQEVLVWRHRVQAGGRLDQVAGQCRRALAECPPDRCDVGIVNRLRPGVRIDHDVRPVQPDLGITAGRGRTRGVAGRQWIRRQAVDRAPAGSAIVQPARHRRGVGARGRDKPGLHLSRHRQQWREFRNQPRRPRAGRDDDGRSPLRSLVGLNCHAGIVFDDAPHARADAQFGSTRAPDSHCRVHRRFGPDDACVRLEGSDGIVRNDEPRETGPQRRCIEPIHRQAPAAGGVERPMHDLRPLRAHHQHSAAVQQPFAGLSFQRLEARGRVSQQRDVVRMLEIGVTKNAREPVTRAAGVRRSVQFDAKHVRAGLARCPEGSAADGTDADDDQIPAAQGFLSSASAFCSCSNVGHLFASACCSGVRARHHASVALAVSASGR